MVMILKNRKFGWHFFLQDSKIQVFLVIQSVLLLLQCYTKSKCEVKIGVSPRLLCRVNEQ